MNDSELQDQINKRLTLNWLIQGVAQQTALSVQHLVRDELHAMNPRFLRLNDQFALYHALQYWRRLEFGILFGMPQRFWKRAAGNPNHPFFNHPLLSRYGGMMAEASRQYVLLRCKEKGVSRLPVLSTFKFSNVVALLRSLERQHRQGLVELAKKVASTLWGIPIERLHGALQKPVLFGTPLLSRGFRGQIFKAGLIGLGGVVQDGDELEVVGQATIWQILVKELVKATAELICLHGLSQLDDATSDNIIFSTDLLDYEPWMLQSGAELWRRLLAAAPPDRPMAEILMHMARLPPKSLESLMIAVIEQPDWARELLAALGQDAAPTAG